MEEKIENILKGIIIPEPLKGVNAGSEPMSAVKKRLLDSAIEIMGDPGTIEDAMFQHSIFCQTYLPYRDPGDQVTLWEQKQGNASLAIQTMRLKNPVTEEWLQVGLPYGTRARLILAYINTQAIKGQSQVIDVEENLSAFIKKLGLTSNGRTINEIKEQIRRITASIITLGYKDGNVYIPINFGIVKAFDLWFPKDDSRKVSWTSKLCLTDDYFNSLMKHAIPLDERAIVALSHSAMALDVYTWLVQRLHRIPHGEKHFVAWQQLKDQFGQGFSRMDNFKSAFRDVLKLVLLQYFDARNSVIEDKNKGLILKNAPTPIGKKVFAGLEIPKKIEK